MANINIENISDLNLNGNDLFEDSEDFMTEISEDYEIESVFGGLRAATFKEIGEINTIKIGCVGQTCQASKAAKSETVIIVYNK